MALCQMKGVLMKGKLGISLSLISLLVIMGTTFFGCGSDGDKDKKPNTWSVTKIQSNNEQLSAYNGTYKSNDTQMTIVVADGLIYEYFFNNNNNTSYREYGNGSVETSGSFSGEYYGLRSPNIPRHGTFTGNIVSGSATLRWEDGNPWSATKEADVTSLKVYAGSYQGSFSGEDSGGCIIGIGNDGTVIVLGNSAAKRVGIQTIISGNGQLAGSGYLVDVTNGSTGVINISGAISGSQGSGAWSST